MHLFDIQKNQNEMKMKYTHQYCDYWYHNRVFNTSLKTHTPCLVEASHIPSKLRSTISSFKMMNTRIFTAALGTMSATSSMPLCSTSIFLVSSFQISFRSALAREKNTSSTTKNPHQPRQEYSEFTRHSQYLNTQKRQEVITLTILEGSPITS